MRDNGAHRGFVFLGSANFMEATSGRVPDISERLTACFRRLVPLSVDKAGKRLGEKELAAKSQNALEEFYSLAYQERRSHRLGLVSRARVAFGVQQRLIKAGYPPPLIKQVLFAMLISAFIGKSQ